MENLINKIKEASSMCEYGEASVCCYADGTPYVLHKGRDGNRFIGSIYQNMSDDCIKALADKAMQVRELIRSR